MYETCSWALRNALSIPTVKPTASIPFMYSKLDNHSAMMSAGLSVPLPVATACGTMPSCVNMSWPRDTLKSVLSEDSIQSQIDTINVVLRDFVDVCGTRQVDEAVVISLSVTAPANSCYSGAKFLLEVMCKPKTMPDLAGGLSVSSVVFKSDVYHPLFAKNKQLCACVTNHQSLAFPTSEVASVAQTVLYLLEKPHIWRYCPKCAASPQALAELRTDPDFFSRKARVHTPMATPPADTELRSQARPDWGDLLRTGAFSDVKLVS